jgi:tRNA(Ile2) C34 agmatinyltransferase TiaS
MGFGPPVCVDCGVSGYLDERKGWRCPNCADEASRSTWLYDKLRKDNDQPTDENS